jgi:S-formylglutathione hydrolase
MLKQIGLVVAFALAVFPMPALAQAALGGKVVQVRLESKLVPGPVEIAVYTPPGYDPARTDPYPLLLQLHGGGGSSQQMGAMATTLEEATRRGLIPQVVSVMPSAGRSFYMDYRDGSQKWETFILTELLPHMRKTYRVAPGREGTLVTGVSMGGMGSLRLALKHPDVFRAVAAMEPGIEPALAFRDIQLRDRFWRDDALMQSIYGKPVDEAYWALNNPATIAKADPSRLKGLGIYIEAGDQDMFFLHHGTEFLHRVLFDAGVSHEYRLVKGAEHVGPSIAPRFLDALGFLGRELNPPTAWTGADAVKAARNRVDAFKRTAGYPVAPHDPESLRTE